MDAQIGISEKNTQSVAFFLSKILADEFVLYVKTRKAHWNVEGPDFYEKHKFFEAQYEDLDGLVDDVAERIRIIGHFPPSSLSEYLKLTHLSEIFRSDNGSQGLIAELLGDHDSIILKLRENIDGIQNDLANIGTADFLTSLLEKHEKLAWFLRSHLK